MQRDQQKFQAHRQSPEGFCLVRFLHIFVLVVKNAKRISFVVPFFISDGLHSYQDIPVLLGIETEPGEAASRREIFRTNPHQIHGRTLYYSSAIGTDLEFADLILEQVEAFDKKE